MTARKADPDPARICSTCDAATFGPRRFLIRAALSLLAKLALLLALYFLFFAPPHRPSLTGAGAAVRFLNRLPGKGASP